MKSKRLNIVVISLLVNFILFSIGMYMGSDLTAMGAGLSLLNAPLYGYLFAETKRKSE